MTNPLQESYRVRTGEKFVFGSNWVCTADVLPHGEPRQAAYYPATNPEGHNVDVMVTAMPARFYELRVDANGGKPGYRITTGSSQGHLSHLIATAIADGMLGFEQKDQAN